MELTIGAVEAGPTIEEPGLLERRPADEKETDFLDRSAGLPLDPALVARAREEEWAYMEELGVMEPGGDGHAAHSYGLGRYR